ncbi:MAG: hypothetical protein CL811_04365 [Colwelliaceae bacterium]|nr:hypothetical protein [Colwelliaceae bacterium]
MYKKACLLGLGYSLSTMAWAADIDLTIVGNGSVTAKEAEVDCQTDCNITNALTKNTLVATASGSGSFTGWTGQKCDAGNGVFINDELELLSNAGNGVKTLVRADIDHDGDEDLAYISLFDGNVGLFRNNGEGNFSGSDIGQNLSYPAGLAFYDWNNDGNEDLLVTEYRSSKIKLYLNNGSGGFDFSHDMRISNYQPYAIAVADINNDGLPDLAVSSFNANTSGNLSQLVDSIRNERTAWYTNDGNDEFTQASLVSSKAAITLDAYKNDESGTIELVAAEIKSGDISLYTITPDNLNATAQVITNSQSAYGVAFGDIDDNGTMDVLSSHYAPSLTLLTLRETGQTFSPSIELDGFNAGVTATAISDINGDGYKDVVTGEFNSNQFLYFASKGYEECVVTSEAKIAVTANFSSQSQSNNSGSSGQQPQSNDGSSGGGSTSWGVLLLILVLSLRAQFRN